MKLARLLRSKRTSEDVYACLGDAKFTRLKNSRYKGQAKSTQPCGNADDAVNHPARMSAVSPPEVPRSISQRLQVSLVGIVPDVE